MKSIKKRNQNQWMKMIAVVLSVLTNFGSIPYAAEWEASPAGSYQPVVTLEEQDSTQPLPEEVGPSQGVLDFLQQEQPLVPMEEKDFSSTAYGASAKKETESLSQNRSYEYERYSAEEARDLLRPEYAAAVILKTISGNDLRRLQELPFETAIVVLDGEIVLFTTGNESEIGSSKPSAELLKKAAFVSHIHSQQTGQEGPSSFDLHHAVKAPGVEYVITEDGAYAYNEKGIQNAGQKLSLEEVANLIEESRELARQKEGEDQVTARSDLNEFIREMDLYNQTLIENRETFRRGNPVAVSTLEDLRHMQNDLGGEYYLLNDIDASETVNWNGGAGFEPIGTRGNAFQGTFDGNGFKITHLHINRPNEDYVGLFGSVEESGSIANVELENASILGRNNVGSITGYLFLGSISNSWAEGGTVSGVDRVGGLIGESYNGLGINNSHTHVSVNGNDKVGGIVGKLWDGTQNDLIQSYALGTVSGRNEVGGLAGYSKSGDLIRSYATGNVTGQDRVGGLVGQTTENAGIHNSYYAGGRVSGTTNNVGGISGLYNSYDDGISNTYFAGTVTSPAGAGGFLGTYNAGIISNNYWDTTLNPGLQDTVNRGDMAGITGRDTVTMQTQSTYTGWDFSNIWIMDGYPRLQQSSAISTLKYLPKYREVVEQLGKNGHIQKLSDGRTAVYEMWRDSDPSKETEENWVRVNRLWIFDEDLRFESLDFIPRAYADLDRDEMELAPDGTVRIRRHYKTKSDVDVFSQDGLLVQLDSSTGKTVSFTYVESDYSEFNSALGGWTTYYNDFSQIGVQTVNRTAQGETRLVVKSVSTPFIFSNGFRLDFEYAPDSFDIQRAVYYDRTNTLLLEANKNVGDSFFTVTHKKTGTVFERVSLSEAGSAFFVLKALLEYLEDAAFYRDALGQFFDFKQGSAERSVGSEGILIVEPQALTVIADPDALSLDLEIPGEENQTSGLERSPSALRYKLNHCSSSYVSYHPLECRSREAAGSDGTTLLFHDSGKIAKETFADQSSNEYFYRQDGTYEAYAHTDTSGKTYYYAQDTQTKARFTENGRLLGETINGVPVFYVGYADVGFATVRDAILFAPSGSVIQLNIGSHEVVSEVIDKSLTLRGQPGRGPEEVVITTNGKLGRHFTIRQGQTVTFENLTLKEGGRGNGSVDFGGSIHGHEAVITFRNVIFDNNYSQVLGAPLHFWGGNVTIENSIFRNNGSNYIANSGGFDYQTAGAIYISGGNLTVRETLFQSNSGSAIIRSQHGANVTVEYSQFFDTSTAQAAIVSYSGVPVTVRVTHSAFMNNSSNQGTPYFLNQTPSQVTLIDQNNFFGTGITNYLEEINLSYLTSPGTVDEASQYPHEGWTKRGYTQPSHWGFYAQLLATIAAGDMVTDKISVADAKTKLQTLMTALLTDQAALGHQGLMPWLEFDNSNPQDPKRKRALGTYGEQVSFFDNANLSAALAAASGALKPLAGDAAVDSIRTQIDNFLTNQDTGYQTLFHSASEGGPDQFYRGIKISNGAPIDSGAHIDAINSEARSGLLFVMLRYNFPDNAYMKAALQNYFKGYTYKTGTKAGSTEVLLAPFDGGAFQVLWPFLTMPENFNTGLGEMLGDFVDAALDYSAYKNLPGFLSASFGRDYFDPVKHSGFVVGQGAASKINDEKWWQWTYGQNCSTAPGGYCWGALARDNVNFAAADTLQLAYNSATTINSARLEFKRKNASGVPEIVWSSAAFSLAAGDQVKTLNITPPAHINASDIDEVVLRIDDSGGNLNLTLKSFNFNQKVITTEYAGGAGIGELAVNTANLDETAASVYTLGAAHMLRPTQIENLLVNEILLKRGHDLITAHGLWEGYDVGTGQQGAITEQVASNIFTFLLGLAGKGPDQMAVYLADKGYYNRLASFYTSAAGNIHAQSNAICIGNADGSGLSCPSPKLGLPLTVSKPNFAVFFILNNGTTFPVNANKLTLQYSSNTAFTSGDIQFKPNNSGAINLTLGGLKFENTNGQIREITIGLPPNVLLKNVIREMTLRGFGGTGSGISFKIHGFTLSGSTPPPPPSGTGGQGARAPIVQDPVDAGYFVTYLNNIQPNQNNLPILEYLRYSLYESYGRIQSTLTKAQRKIMNNLFGNLDASLARLKKKFTLAEFQKALQLLEQLDQKVRLSGGNQEATL